MAFAQALWNQGRVVWIDKSGFEVTDSSEIIHRSIVAIEML